MDAQSVIKWVVIGQLNYVDITCYSRPLVYDSDHQALSKAQLRHEVHLQGLILVSCTLCFMY